MTRASRVPRALVTGGTPATRAAARRALSLVPERMLRFVADAGCVVRVLRPGERYNAASAELAKLGVDVDAWPVPPAGLFVVAERTVYLRTVDIMTTVHEFGHALDCALGRGVYHSGTSTVIRQAFAAARAFVTPYAATGLDEYFAEGFRAYVGANLDSSPWPKATPESLAEKSPALFNFFASLERHGAFARAPQGIAAFVQPA